MADYGFKRAHIPGVTRPITNFPDSLNFAAAQEPAIYEPAVVVAPPGHSQLDPEMLKLVVLILAVLLLAMLVGSTWAKK